MKYVVKINVKDLEEAKKLYADSQEYYDKLVYGTMSSKGITPNSNDQITVITHTLPTTVETIPDKPY